MGEVNLAIHGKSYGVACDNGQEQRVLQLGKLVDSRLREIAAAGAASNESHLLVLTAIVMADEIQELHETMKHMAPANANAAVSSGSVSKDDERQLAAAIDHLAIRITSVASRLREIES